MTDTTARIDELEVALQIEKMKSHKVRMKLLEIARVMADSKRIPTPIDRLSNALVMVEDVIDIIDF